MRTFLTRVTFAAAGVVFAGGWMAGMAYAGPDTQPVLEPCDPEVAEFDELLLPGEDEPQVEEKPQIELVPCYQLPTEPPDDDDGDDGNDDGDDGNDDGGDDGNDDGGNGGNGGGGAEEPTTDGDPQGGQNGGAGSGGSPAEDDAEQPDGAGSPTPEAESVSPVTTEQAIPVSRDGGGTNALLALFAGALGAAGLAIFGYALRKRRTAQ